MSEINKQALQDDLCCNECEVSSFKPNQCKEECCEPKTLECPTDITTAKCIPILTERIYDCICINHKQTTYIAPLVFTVDPPPPDVTYVDGAAVCIDYIATNYDFIGLDAPTLDIILNSTVLTGALTETAEFDCGGTPLYTSYEGNIALNAGCCGLKNKGEKSSIIETALSFFICNLEYVVRGKIGCDEFTARFSSPGSIPLNASPIDFYGSMCLPNENKTIRIEETFDPCYSADCITPTTSYASATNDFSASLIACFNIDKNITATVKERLVVYTSPEGKLCGDGNTGCSCNSDC